MSLKSWHSESWTKNFEWIISLELINDFIHLVVKIFITAA